MGEFKLLMSSPGQNLDGIFTLTAMENTNLTTCLPSAKQKVIFVNNKC